MKGGAPKVIKKFLKRDEAVKQITDKSKKNIAKDWQVEDEAVPQPPELAPFTQKVEERIAFLRTMKESGQSNNIENMLEEFSDVKLKSMLDILMETRGVGAETKLQNLADVVLGDDFTLMDTCEKYIAQKRLELMNMFVDVYAKEFVSESKGQFCYHHELLKKQVESLIEYRRRVMKDAQSEAVPAVAPQESACAVS